MSGGIRNSGQKRTLADLAAEIADRRLQQGEPRARIRTPDGLSFRGAAVGGSIAGAGGSAPGGSIGTPPSIISVKRAQLVVANNSSASVSLGSSADTGHAELSYQFKRGSLRGAGRLRLWHDGSNVNVEHIEFSGDDPGAAASGSFGWSGSISGGSVLLTWNSDNSGNSTTYNLAYITTEAI